MSDKKRSLELLQDRIGQCRVCEQELGSLLKPAAMDRGHSGPVAIIGEGPGNHELEKERAFAGPSGRRLEEWLVNCGASADNPRDGIHFTSVVKCVKQTPADLTVMVHNCQRFLVQQLQIVRPALIITVGRVAYEQIRQIDAEYGEALCRVYSTSDYVLVTPFGFHFNHLVWPHPSPMSRWHNDPNNQQKLEESFTCASRLLAEAKACK